MSLLRRITALFKIKAGEALDRVEDPRELLDYSYDRQLDLLIEVRRGVADVATDLLHHPDSWPQPDRACAVSGRLPGKPAPVLPIC